MIIACLLLFLFFLFFLTSSFQLLTFYLLTANHFSASFWISLVAQLVKNPPAMWETWVQYLGWEDPLEKGKVPTPVFWPGEFQGVAKSRTQLSDFYFHFQDLDIIGLNLHSVSVMLFPRFLQILLGSYSQGHL